jgi:hypothetical protein
MTGRAPPAWPLPSRLVCQGEQGLDVHALAASERAPDALEVLLVEFARAVVELGPHAPQVVALEPGRLTLDRHSDVEPHLPLVWQHALEGLQDLLAPIARERRGRSRLQVALGDIGLCLLGERIAAEGPGVVILGNVRVPRQEAEARDVPALLVDYETVTAFEVGRQGVERLAVTLAIDAAHRGNAISTRRDECHPDKLVFCQLVAPLVSTTIQTRVFTRVEVDADQPRVVDKMLGVVPSGEHARHCHAGQHALERLLPRFVWFST